MSAIQDIFAEYARMRENGLDSKTALRSLKAYTDMLGANDKSTLAQTLRAWEAGEIAAPRVPAAGTETVTAEKVAEERSTGIKAIGKKNAPAEKKGVIRSIAPKKPAEDPDQDWVVCTKCGKKSLRREVFCHACGTILDVRNSTEVTQQFTNPDDPMARPDYFGPESILILQVRGQTDQYELSPQVMGHEMVIGRATPGSVMTPDIDLTEAQAASLGVSRLHMSLRYDSQNGAIKVNDLGSANGSYINGQRLHPQEVRVLRHGDVLRLGKLVMEVRVQHRNAR